MDVEMFEVVGRGQWVGQHEVNLGAGAAASLQNGLLFPVVDRAGTNAGFVFLGRVSTTMPMQGDELAVRAVLPAADLHDSVWTSSGQVVLALGRSADLAAAAATGRPILDDRREVAYLDEAGREVLVVTDLSPRAALADARRTLRNRSAALTEVGLDPQAMLDREQWRQGEPRLLVELEPELDLRPLVATASAQADIVRPWLKPRVSSLVASDGSVQFVVDPPVGTWDLPVQVGARTRWVTLTDGVGVLNAPGGARIQIDPTGLLPLEVRSGAPRLATGDPIQESEPGREPTL